MDYFYDDKNIKKYNLITYESKIENCLQKSMNETEYLSYLNNDNEIFGKKFHHRDD